MESNATSSNISNLHNAEIDIGNIVNGSISGDVIAGDKVAGDKVLGYKVVHNITHIIERALTSAEEAERLRSIATQRLAEGVRDYAQRLHAIATSQADPGRDNPYQGLLPYHLSDADLFFGRGRAIKELLSHLPRDPLTVLHSESGAGKSSLLQAGISPYLLSAGHLPLCLRPHHLSPTLAVKQAFLPSLADIPELVNAPLRDFLCQVTAVLGPTTTLYLLLDQFEEIFTLLNERDRTAFVSEFADCLEDESLNVRWVLAVRSEYFGDLACFRPRIRNPFENDYRLNRLTLIEAKTVITEPAARQGITFEPELVGTLLQDLHDEQTGEISPPQLQLVCSALSSTLREQQAEQPGRPPTITLHMYKEEGQAQGILRGYLKRVLQRTLNKRERELARQLLVALVSADQRRIRRTRSELAATLATYIASAQSLDELLDQLVDSRLLSVEKDETTDEPFYELAHDYLVDEIEIDPEVRTQKAAQELLAQEVEAYKHFKTLLSEDKFNIINSQRKFLTLTDEAAELLHLSQAARRRAQIQRIGVVAFVMVLIIGAALAIALIQSRAAEQARQSALRARSLALAASAQRALSDHNTDLAIALALEANRIDHPSEQARNALAAATYYSPGTIRQFVGHTDRVNSVAFKPQDGRTAVSGSADNSLILWNIESGENGPTIRKFVSHTAGVNSVAFSPDGRKILSGSSDDSLILWDVESGAVVRRFLGHGQPVNSVAFSPDGRTVLSGSDDGDIILWNTASGAEIFGKTCPGAVSSVAFSPDGHLLAAGTQDDDTVCVWNAETGELIRSIQPAAGHGVASLALSPDNRWVLVGAVGYGPGIFLWDINTGALIDQLAGHIGGNTQVALSSDGQRAITGSYDNSLILWDIENGTEIQRFAGHTDDVTSVTFSPDDRTVLSGSADNTLRLWDISAGEEIRRFTGFVGFALSLDGNKIAASQDYFHPVLLDTNTGEVRRMEGEAGQLISLAFSPDGRIIFSGGWDGKVHRWDTERRSLIDSFTGHPNGVTSIVISRDGRYALSGSYGPPNWPDFEALDDLLLLWDTDTGRIDRRFVGHDHIVRSVALSSDGQLALSGSDDTTVRLWDTQSGEARQVFAGHTDPVRSVAFGPGDRTVLSASTDQTIRLWDIETGQEIRRFTGHTMAVMSVALSPDGRTVLSGSDDGSLRLWDIATGLELGRLTGHHRRVWNVAFSPDGHTVWSRSADKTIRLWQIQAPDNLIQWTCANRYVRELTCSERRQFGVEPFCNENGPPPIPGVCQSVSPAPATTD